MKYFSPTTIDELVNIAQECNSNAAIVAGCTDILVKKNFFEGKSAVIQTNEIKELQKIEDIGDKTRIGACVTFSDIINSNLIKKYHKALHSAAQVCGSVQIRNRATIAGNIINASPAADSIPSLMIYNAELILVSKEGEERCKIKDFFTGPGRTKLKSGQILAFIEIEKEKPASISFYRKIGTRKALSIAKASVAFKAEKTNGKVENVEFAFGSVGPTVIASKKTKEALEGKELNNESIETASNAAYDEVTPIDDIRSTADYRKLVVKNVIIEELRQLV